MENRNLDRIVKDMVTNFELRYSPGSWERFEKKLSIIEKQDSDFDTRVADKLNKHFIPVQSGSFARFQKKTGLYGKRKYRSAFIIMGIAASLLLLFIALIGLKKETSAPGSSDDNKTKITIADQSKLKSGSEIVERDELTGISKLNESEQLFSSSKISRASFGPKESQVKEVKASNFGLAFRYSPNLNTPNTMLFTLMNQRQVYNWKTDNKHTDIPIFHQYKTFESIQILSFDVEIVEEIQTAAIKDKNRRYKESNDPVIFEKNLNDTTAIATISQVYGINDFALNDPKSGKKPNFSTKIYGGPQFWMIKTPNDLSLNKPGYRNNSLGYNLGAGFSVTSGNHEIMTGVGYSAFNYSPRKQVLSHGNKSFWLDDISFGLISIPIIYNYLINVRENLVLYPSFGVTGQMIAISGYKFIEREGGISEIGKLAKELIDNSDFARTAYGNKEYRPGVIEGGKTSGNFSLTFNVGLGIKARLRDDVSIFAETGYSGIIFNNSFGPNNDHLSSFKLNIGLNKTISL